jgi:hypothetical protein
MPITRCWTKRVGANTTPTKLLNSPGPSPPFPTAFLALLFAKDPVASARRTGQKCQVPMPSRNRPLSPLPRRINQPAHAELPCHSLRQSGSVAGAAVWLRSAPMVQRLKTTRPRLMGRPTSTPDPCSQLPRESINRPRLTGTSLHENAIPCQARSFPGGVTYWASGIKGALVKPAIHPRKPRLCPFSPCGTGSHRGAMPLNERG